MKRFAMLSLVFAVSNAFAAASEQGCTSSSGAASGCGSVNVSPTTTVSPTISPQISPQFSVSPVNLNSNQNSNLNVNNTYNTANGGAGGSAIAGASASTASSATATNAGNNQSVTFTSPEKVTVKSTGDAPAIIGSATAPCRVAVGASAGWLGGAFGIGTSVMDESCNLREISRHLYNLGLKTEAIKVMCADETAKAAIGAFCQ